MNLRRHQPICTAVEVSLPSGSTCFPLTTVVRLLAYCTRCNIGSAARTYDLVLAVFTIVDLVRRAERDDGQFRITALIFGMLRAAFKALLRQVGKQVFVDLAWQLRRGGTAGWPCRDVERHQLWEVAQTVLPHVSIMTTTTIQALLTSKLTKLSDLLRMTLTGGNASESCSRH